MIGEGLEILDLTVRRGRRTVISGFDLSLPAGTVTALIGPNGVGKSTLLAAIAGQIPASGTIRFAGRPHRPDHMAFLPQAQAVQSRLSVLEVLLLGRREKLGWKISGEDLAAADTMLRTFHLPSIADQAMDTLSGGQQQMVLLAQRLMRDPSLLILDEPTSALDLHHQLRVLAILRDYARRRRAVVLAAIHDLSLAARQCDRVALMRAGSLHCVGEPEAVLTPANVGSLYRVELDVYRNHSGLTVNVPVAPLGAGDLPPHGIAGGNG